MASVSFVAAQEFGATLTVTYDSATLVISTAVVDATQMTVPVLNYDVEENGSVVTSGQVLQGSTATFQFPQNGPNVQKMIATTGPSGSGVRLPCNLSIWT